MFPENQREQEMNTSDTENKSNKIRNIYLTSKLFCMYSPLVNNNEQEYVERDGCKRSKQARDIEFSKHPKAPKFQLHISHFWT